MFRLLLLIAFTSNAVARPKVAANDDDYDDKYMHDDKPFGGNSRVLYNEEEVATYWNRKAQDSIKQKLSSIPIEGIAKNVILFLGDGMSIPTLASSRIYLGQQANKDGESEELSFEKFPFVGLSKTYCVDSQVADSACSATAYLGGVKTNYKTIGVTAAVKLNDCEAMLNSSNHVYSIAKWAQDKGKKTGIVTTTRVTDASPSGAFAHVANRNWESDKNVKESGQDPTRCRDIAYQLVHGETGKNLNVILGGGRKTFFPNTMKDEDGGYSERLDNRNLIEEWLQDKRQTGHYVTTRDALQSLPSDTEYVLGLFKKSHMNYEIERSRKKKPSLTEMTVAALKILSRGEKGYFLFVEGGRIDHAHHSNRAKKSLDETVEFHRAVEAAVKLTDVKDTLIVVTSDHSHTMTFNGYPKRNNDILGLAGTGSDAIPYTTLSYANGPGYVKETKGSRHDVSQDDLSDLDYRYPAAVPKKTETHGGDDVGIFARGPWAHLLTGVNEQNVIPHIMAYASCVGDGITVCDKK